MMFDWRITVTPKIVLVEVAPRKTRTRISPRQSRTGKGLAIVISSSGRLGCLSDDADVRWMSRLDDDDGMRAG
jgi:hypothetical protein